MQEYLGGCVCSGLDLADRPPLPSARETAAEGPRGRTHPDVAIGNMARLEPGTPDF